MDVLGLWMGIILPSRMGTRLLDPVSGTAAFPLDALSTKYCLTSV